MPTALMSNSKWRKLFEALDRDDLVLTTMRVKFVDDEQVRTVHTPRTSQLEFEGHFDSIEFGPVRLSDIEWIEFPQVVERHNPPPDGRGRVPPTLTTQSLDDARAILATLGTLPIDRTTTGLRISGYSNP